LHIGAQDAVANDSLELFPLGTIFVGNRLRWEQAPLETKACGDAQAVLAVGGLGASEP